MPIPIGVLAVAGAGAVAATGAYERLTTQILTGNQTTITFSNLNSTYGSTYQHLQLRIVAAANEISNINTIRMTFNGDTGTNYAIHRLFGDGTTVTSDGNGTTPVIEAGEIPGGNIDSGNAWGPVIIDILDPFETTKNKTIRSLSGNAAPQFPRLFFRSGLWNNTAALTTITMTCGTVNNFRTGSRFSLYGLRSA